MLQQLKDQVFIKPGNLSIAVDYKQRDLSKCMSDAWNNVAPTWPLQSYIARNPLAGLEDKPFIEALATASKYFEDLEIPSQMLDINRETIKWCQAIFDLNQATIAIPLHGKTMFEAWKSLAIHDSRLHMKKRDRVLWLKTLPNEPLLAIKHCLDKLAIPSFEYAKFFTLMLVTLPGWAGHVKYLVEYSDNRSDTPIELIDYLALRLVIACTMWPEAAEILCLPLKAHNRNVSELINQLTENEIKYSTPLIESVLLQLQDKHKPDNHKVTAAQLVFCIDVRSEPFRRAIESQGEYETFGYAGFFGIPISIRKHRTAQDISSCPVLIKAKHNVCETHNCTDSKLAIHNLKSGINDKLKSIYKSLKHSFTTPFLLVEIIGPLFGLLLISRSINSSATSKLKSYASSLIKPTINIKPSKDNIDAIAFDERCQYAKNALLMTGLVNNFAPVVLLCGHKSCTDNNPYASALDCGACGGNKGGYNAQVLAEILNDPAIRSYLNSISIFVPSDTIFVAAEHNTTTDEVEIFNSQGNPAHIARTIEKLTLDLHKARINNNKFRAEHMQLATNESNLMFKINQRSLDWSQTRPEWGLARNASFIVAPRKLTENLDLDGRSFLHSYDWRFDSDGSALETILTAPLVVAQWINCQYLFSTANNIVYGSGSKVTQNITGKIGIVQGNASDLMHGLPIQSVKIDDDTNYHELLRLTAVVYAPLEMISSIISKHQLLKNLFSNNWVLLCAIDPLTNKAYRIDNDLNWQSYELL